jgi:hypothetical protein
MCSLCVAASKCELFGLSDHGLTKAGSQFSADLTLDAARELAVWLYTANRRLVAGAIAHKGNEQVTEDLFLASARFLGDCSGKPPLVVAS